MSKTIIGLTGGIASGKSTVAHLLERHGIAVFDADQVARDIVKPGEECLSKIAEHFGDHVINDDNTLNRHALKEIIFNAPDERIWLENLTHPLIRQQLERSAKDSEADISCLMIPLLHTKESYPNISKIIVVDVSEETQLKRLLKRDNINEAQAAQILKAQISREERLKLADYVIQNDGIEIELAEQVASVLEQL